MGYRTVTVDVDIYVDDIINEVDDQVLIDELESRGYTVTKEAIPDALDSFDWRMIEDIVNQLPYHWETERLRQKIVESRMPVYRK